MLRWIKMIKLTLRFRWAPFTTNRSIFCIYMQPFHISFCNYVFFVLFWPSDRPQHNILQYCVHFMSIVCTHWTTAVLQRKTEVLLCIKYFLCYDYTVQEVNGPIIIMRPSSLGGGRILRRTLSVCLSVCPSVCLSVRPVIITERHVAPPSELQWHTWTFRYSLRAAYRTAISAAQILVINNIIIEL